MHTHTYTYTHIIYIYIYIYTKKRICRGRSGGRDGKGERAEDIAGRGLVRVAGDGDGHGHGEGASEKQVWSENKGESEGGVRVREGM